MVTVEMLRTPSLARTEAPADLPVTVSELKANLNLSQDDDSHDAKLLARIEAATEQLEHDTDSVLITQQFIYYLPALVSRSYLLKIRPIIGVDSITYVDTDGLDQVIDVAVYGFSHARRWLFLRDGQSWPTCEPNNPDAVRIAITAGYGTRQNVPALAKQAILLQASKWFLDPAMESGTGYNDDRAYQNLVDKLLRETYP